MYRLQREIEVNKPSRTEQMILSRINAAVKIGKKVTVDGVRIRGARFRNGEIEVEWDAEIDGDIQWTAIEPNYLHEFENGELELKTY